MAEYKEHRDVTLPLRRTTRRSELPKEVAAYIREVIFSSEVQQGEFLRVERIASAVGVSNTPVREALLSLAGEGLVDLVPRRGFRVAAISQEDVRDLFWAQARFASELAARAAAAITPDQIEQLKQTIELYEVAIDKGDGPAIRDLGHEYHRTINLAADSPRLAALLGSVVRQLPSRFYASVEGQLAATRREHPEILAAIQSGDGERARLSMESHMTAQGDRVINELKKQAFWADPAGLS